MNSNEEKNNPRLILSKICKDLLILEFRLYINSLIFRPNVKIDFNFSFFFKDHISHELSRLINKRLMPMS
ncbi:hypothetical protein BpHYR1_052218 [Brachionus plicatilis]|uniref:Uncharacterized protein n=1 Tax=Brachionus plicatilis TaxID=10195 RepID=A0A3M7RTD7_BRAPC|nr:hypothetical protein BpHYR1_052218 [Brachionus plicatilis]